MKWCRVTVCGSPPIPVARTQGEIYEYLGATLTPDFNAVTEDHVTSVTPTDLVRGDLVRIDGAATDTGAVIGEVYEYLGNDASNGFEHLSTDTPAAIANRRTRAAAVGYWRRD